MEVKKIYKYGVFPKGNCILEYDIKREFEMKRVEIEVKGKSKHSFDSVSESFYYAESIPGGMHVICLVRELNSTEVDEDGFLYFSNEYENEKELIDKIIDYIEIKFPEDAFRLSLLKEKDKFKIEIYGDGVIDYEIGFVTCVELENYKEDE